MRLVCTVGPAQWYKMPEGLTVLLIYIYIGLRQRLCGQCQYFFVLDGEMYFMIKYTALFLV